MKLLPISLALLILISCEKTTPPIQTSNQVTPIVGNTSSTTQGTTNRTKSPFLNPTDADIVTLYNEQPGGAQVDSIMLDGVIYAQYSQSDSNYININKGVVGDMVVYISNKPAGFFVKCFITANSDAHPRGDDMEMPDYTLTPRDSCQFFNINGDSLTQIILQKG
jgi:hypothetical protein